MQRLLLVFLTILVCGSTALAQDGVSEADKKKAVARLAEGDKALARGDKLMKRGDMEEALEAYEEGLAAYQAALAAFPSPKIYFPIAKAEQKLGRFVDALKHYEQVLAEAKDAPDELRAEIREALGEVKRNLGAIELAVEPDGATILIDGNAIGTAPRVGPDYVEPGQHTIAVTAEGYTPFEEKLELPPGKIVAKKVVLKRVPVAVVEPRPVVEDKAVPPPPSKAGLYVLVGATTALTAGAVLTGVLALGEHGTYADDALPGDERESARSSGKKLAVTTDLLLVGAIAVGAYTTYYYLNDYRPRRRAYDDEYAAADRLWLAPWASAEGGGLAVGGGF